MAPKLAATLGLVLAAALVLPATAATPKRGSWSGSTDQNRSIDFRVTRGGKKVKDLEFGFKGRCDNGARTSGTSKFAGKFPVRDGRFRAKAGDSVVKGKFTTRKKAKGILRWEGSFFDPFTFRSSECTSGRVDWRARR